MVSSQPQQTHIYHSMSEAVNEAEQPAQPPVAEQSSNKQLVVEGQTVTLVTAGVGRGVQASSIWKYLVEFENHLLALETGRETSSVWSRGRCRPQD